MIRAHSHSHYLPFALLALAACGNSPPPPAAEPAASAAATAAPAPTQAAAPAGPDKAAIEQCFATANVGHAKFSGEAAKVTLKHVLVKYKDAKKADASITRSRGEACLRAIEARDKLVKGAEWDQVVKEFSDEAGAATRGGSMGTVERKDLVKKFADAAFDLKANEVSNVVESEFGFHIIFRTE
jgi:hypothetical protein